MDTAEAIYRGEKDSYDQISEMLQSNTDKLLSITSINLHRTISR